MSIVIVCEDRVSFYAANYTETFKYSVDFNFNFIVPCQTREFISSTFTETVYRIYKF